MKFVVKNEVIHCHIDTKQGFLRRLQKYDEIIYLFRLLISKLQSLKSGRFGQIVVAFLKKLELYKSRNLSLTPTASPTSRPLRQPCYSPDEFHRGIQAMQSWFRNLDDSQRTLALQSITVRTTLFFDLEVSCINLTRFSLNYDITTVNLD